jgi:hypothetical protein
MNYQLSVDGLHFLYSVFEWLFLHNKIFKFHEGFADTQHHPSSILCCHLFETTLLKAANLKMVQKLFHIKKQKLLRYFSKEKQQFHFYEWTVL